ncbi:MAG TPA: polysaccharide deacetylase family protein, partial [Blastocatellia bacterium]|nr:polysaccharide deacetylase family protein [Blastocatellia bacterium]
VCSYVLWKKRGAVVPDFDLIGPGIKLDLRSEQGRSQALNLLIKYCEREKLHPEQKDELARALADRLGVDYDEILARRILHIMNPQEVAELSGAGIDFQLHTHLHRTPLDRVLFEKEIEDNRVKIQEMTNSNPTHFCYPSGNYNQSFLPWLAETNVVTATTCDPGIVSSGSNPLLLPRLVDSRFLTTLEFEGWLTGVASVMARHRKRRRKHADGGNGGTRTGL